MQSAPQTDLGQGYVRATDEGSGLIWGMLAAQIGFIALLTVAAAALAG